MSGWLIVLLVIICCWLAVLTVFTLWLWQQRTPRTRAGASPREATQRLSERRVMGRFRVPVDLPASLRIGERAWSCRVTELARTNAEINCSGDRLPLGMIGTLSIDAGEFDRATVQVTVQGDGPVLGVYDLSFVDPTPEFSDNCAAMIRQAFSASG